ncbi:hypothetical protein J2W49_001697 [Hydrogenophaga palleronii]|uniref:Type III effector protein n=1 Tax=Hydrogenophaga palleronii TaxID=65655 RepID=A0ABU1WKC9_9BURK|nr:type III effector protein [Hydrogenophaga palleronii]MDR7149742.1 hypothetical protein [Hydrogenophaga palleronii]
MSIVTGTTPTRSPEPLVPSGGRTSTAPSTPQTQVALEGAPPSRVAAIVDGAAGMARRVGLPQAAAAVADSSVAQALGGLASAVAKPAASLAVDIVATGIKGVKQAAQPSASSQPLQAALGANLAQADAQMSAHEQAVAYGKHSAQMLDRVLPFVLSVARIAVAGTSMAFGLGRNSGAAAGDAAARAARGAEQSGGVISGSAAPASTLSSEAVGHSLASGVKQWALGAATGAAGNLAGQFVVTPVLNLMPRQFNPIDARAVVPDETVALMNQLKPGSGNELRDQVKANQGEITNISSASNVKLGQISFDAITAGRFAMQGATPLGVAGQVSVGLAVSATAGAAIGATMAVRQSVATMDIPKIDDLRQAVAAGLADGPAMLAQVPTNAVPLFFAKHMGAAAPAQAGPLDIEMGGAAVASGAEQRSRMAEIRDTLKAVGNGLTSVVSVPAAAVKQAFVAGPLAEPLPTTPGAESASTANRVRHTVDNVVASGVRRAGEMAAATVGTSAAATVTNMLASAVEGPAQRAVLALGNAVGIHAAIKPWFDALAKDIPAGDNAMKAKRQESVDAQATQRPLV